jgi:glycosyltransferase involved in cell wall biosynthesis
VVEGLQARLRVASLTRRLTVAGDETRLLNTAVAFDKSRVEHAVIVISPSSDEHEQWLGPMRDRYRAAGVEVLELRVQLGGLLDVLRVVGLVRRLAGELRRRRIDVLDARLGTPTATGLVAARLAGVPVVVSTAYYPSLWQTPLRVLVGQASLALVDALVSDARATLDAFDRWRWSRRAELVLIPNGIAPASSELSREAAREALGLPTDPEVRIVGQVSRMIARKGYECFLRAARRVVEQEPRVAFVGVGFVAEARTYHEQLVALRASLGLDDAVRLLSYPGPIGDVYAAIDVFAHLSTEDSSPIAIHESMSAGLPAVVSALPGNLELVEDGETALLVRPDDDADTAQAILRLLRDPALAARLGSGARRRYEERHAPVLMAEAHEALFRRILERKRGSG